MVKKKKKGRSTGARRSRKAVVKKVAPKKVAIDETDARQRILAAIRRIPRGHVCTYGNVADVAGLPRRARLVGTVLRQTPGTRDLPWYRVINAGGRISFPLGSEAHARQKKKLEAEGIDFVGGRVDLSRYGWPPREQHLDELLWGPANDSPLPQGEGRVRVGRLK
jgi:methylated-DNA-protein-cysteine methyltransferase-like protein